MAARVDRTGEQHVDELLRAGVDESAFGDAEIGHDVEADEGQDDIRRRDRASQLRSHGVGVCEGRGGLFEGGVAHHAADRQLHPGEDLVTVDGDESTAHGADFFHRAQHGGIVGADDGDVHVRAVHRDADRSSAQAESAHEPDSGERLGVMPVDHGDLQHVGAGVALHAAALDGELRVERALEVSVVHLHRANMRAGSVGAHAQQIGVERLRQTDAVARPFRHVVVDLEARGPVPSDDGSGDHHRRRAHVGEVGDDLQVGQARRCEESDHLVEPVVMRRLSGGHAVGEHGIDAEPDRLSHVVVDVALGAEIERVLVVGAEAHVAQRRRDRVEVGEQRHGVVGEGGAHDGDHRAEAGALQRFVDGGGVVVVADACGEVAPQRFVRLRRGVAGDAPASQQRLAVAGGGHLAQVERVPLAQSRGDVVVQAIEHGLFRDDSAAALERCGRRCGR